ncbi:4Fe-4S ferredoxin, partial [Micromonospora sp. NPDC005298]
MVLPDPNSLYGPLDPAPDAGYVDAPPRMGFFTDTSVCIGCKACEVACKEWNGVPESGLDLLGMSYDNTGALTANSWRHVAFVEQPRTADVLGEPAPTGPGPQFLGMPGSQPPGRGSGVQGRTDFRWLMMSDVCKH